MESEPQMPTLERDGWHYAGNSFAAFGGAQRDAAHYAYYLDWQKWARARLAATERERDEAIEHRRTLAAALLAADRGFTVAPVWYMMPDDTDTFNDGLRLVELLQHLPAPPRTEEES